METRGLGARAGLRGRGRRESRADDGASWTDEPELRGANTGGTEARTPQGELAATSGDAGGRLMPGEPLPDHRQDGRTQAENDVKGPAAKTPAEIGAQLPAEGANETAVTPTADAPHGNSAPVSASTDSRPVPLQTGRKNLSPDAAPVAPLSVNPAGSASPGETLTAHTEASATADVGAASGRPSAPKIDQPARPNPVRKSARRSDARSAKAIAEATAAVPKPPARPVQPDKAATSPAGRPADPVAGPPVALTAPAPPTSFATQSVGRVKDAFVYLTRLPAALIQRPTYPNTDFR